MCPILAERCDTAGHLAPVGRRRHDDATQPWSTPLAAPAAAIKAAPARQRAAASIREVGAATLNASRAPRAEPSATATDETPASLSSELVAYPSVRTRARCRRSSERVATLREVSTSS